MSAKERFMVKVTSKTTKAIGGRSVLYIRWIGWIIEEALVYVRAGSCVNEIQKWKSNHVCNYKWNGVGVVC